MVSARNPVLVDDITDFSQSLDSVTASDSTMHTLEIDQMIILWNAINDYLDRLATKWSEICVVKSSFLYLYVQYTTCRLFTYIKNTEVTIFSLTTHGISVTILPYAPTQQYIF